MMSPKVQFAYYALWIAHPVLQLTVAGVMFQRKSYKDFRVFFAYVISQVLIFAMLFPISTRGSYFAFFYTYWITAAISLTLGFKVIHEIFLDVFRPYHTLKDLGTVLFKWAGLVMLMVAAVVAAASSASDQGPLVQAVLTVQRCVRVVQCGLVLFLLLFARYLRVSWKQQSFGIALGFGVFASVELIALALRASDYIHELTVALANMGAYNLTILLWLAYAAAKPQAKESSANALVPQRWDQSLLDLRHPLPPDSLIPMFEGMVDRAFSRAKSESETGDDWPATETTAPPDSEATEEPSSDFADSISSALDSPTKH
jgi:hypothetical protein